jgi:hypothetical protein
VYLWARTSYAASPWVSVSLRFSGTAVAGLMRREAYYRAPPPVPGTWFYRWESGSDLDPYWDQEINLVMVSGPQGIGTALRDDASVWEADYLHRHYCLGSIDVLPAGHPMYLVVGPGLIVRSGYTTSTVYFGFDAVGNPELAGSGVIPGTTSATWDLCLLPEPTSVMLLVVAGLALRRR